MVGTMIAGAIVVFSQTACSGTTRKVGDFYCSDLTETFFYGKSIKSRMSDFGNYPVEKQYAIFICGNQVIHPPAIYLVTPFANEGGQVIDFLTGKLAETNDDLTIRDIIFVIAEMSRLHTYDVAHNEKLMRSMEERVKGMKDADWKKMTEEMLKTIRKSP